MENPKYGLIWMIEGCPHVQNIRRFVLEATPLVLSTMAAGATEATGGSVMWLLA